MLSSGTRLRSTSASLRLHIGKLRRRETLLDRQHRFRGQAIGRQDFARLNPLSGVDPQGSDNPFKGQIDPAFQGAEQFAVEDDFGLAG